MQASRRNAGRENNYNRRARKAAYDGLQSKPSFMPSCCSARSRVAVDTFLASFWIVWQSCLMIVRGDFGRTARTHGQDT